MFERKEITQKKLSSHNTTVITTTAFRIDLMELAIGMKRFTSHRRTPTTIRVMTTWSNGMLFLPSVFPVEAVYRSAPAVLRRGLHFRIRADDILYRFVSSPSFLHFRGSGVTETEVPPDNLQSYSCYQRLAYMGRIEFYSIRFMFLSRWGWYNPFQ